MARYIVTGAGGAASATAATAGIVKVDNDASAPITTVKIYEWSIGPGASAEDSNYTVAMKRQTTAGTWTAVTPEPLDTTGQAASLANGGRLSTAAGSAGNVLGYWGFNQRAGFRWVAVPGGELIVGKAVSNGIILEYTVVQGTAVNYGLIAFDE